MMNTRICGSRIMKKNEPVYAEMRSLAPYFLTVGGIYMAIALVIFFAAGFVYSVPIGALYGMILAAANFWALGKAAQNSVQKSEKKANTYMSRMYALRYLGLFLLLTIGAVAPFINLAASVIPLFFPRIAITLREIKKGKEE